MKVRTNLILLMFVVLYTAPIHARVWDAWVARYDGPLGYNDRANAIALDSQGNPCITGYATVGPDSLDRAYLTIKYNTWGEPLWMATFIGPENYGQATSIAVDDEDCVYVTGFCIYHPHPGLSNSDWFTVKYNPFGERLWVARFDSSLADEAEFIALDDARNVIVAGTISDGYEACDIAVVKYNSSGVQQWIAVYSGPGFDYVNDLKVDRGGNIHITGRSWNQATGSDYCTIKYDPDGAQQWVALYAPSNYPDEARSLEIDVEGNVYVTGYCASTPFTSADIVTIKYNSSGTEQWVATYEPEFAEGYDLILDEWGNAYVTGLVGELLDHWDFITLKYNSSGVQQWVARYDGPGHESDDTPDYVALDDSGFVYVAGRTSPPNYPGLSWTIVKYDQDGNREWVHLHPWSGNGWHNGMAIDGEGNIYLAGTVGVYAPSIMDMIWDYVTVKCIQDGSGIIMNLTPLSTPIQIPASGGSFQFDCNVVNRSDSITLDFWAMAVTPENVLQRPALGPRRLSVNTGTSHWRCTQNVPGRVPAGTYQYIGLMGFYPFTVINTDTLLVEKLPAGGRSPVDNWDLTISKTNSDEGLPIANHPYSFNLDSCFPNPFNATTAISYQLSALSFVNLSVYDIAGRKVAELVNGWREAGRHEVTFDGSGLASGVYLYRLTVDRVSGSGATPTTMNGKMVLIK